MPTKYEYYDTNDDISVTVYGAEWVAQTFTPTTSHLATSVKLLLGRLGSPGTLTISLKATSGGNPVGDDLCSGTTNGNNLPIGSPWEWREIIFTTNPPLIGNNTYAIVGRALTGDALNYVIWRVDSTASAYGGGTGVESSDSGTTWFPNSDEDYMFEDWGNSLNFIPKIFYF